MLIYPKPESSISICCGFLLCFTQFPPHSKSKQTNQTKRNRELFAREQPPFCRTYMNNIKKKKCFLSASHAPVIHGAFQAPPLLVTTRPFYKAQSLFPRHYGMAGHKPRLGKSIRPQNGSSASMRSLNNVPPLVWEGGTHMKLDGYDCVTVLVAWLDRRHFASKRNNLKLQRASQSFVCAAIHPLPSNSCRWT